MKTYIVINHYLLNGEIVDLAIQAVKSFRDTHDCIIIGVDDCSPLGHTELEKLHDVWIRLDENKGFAGSANIGFQWILDNIKENCYIVYANNDIKVYDGWFEEFTKYDFDMIGGISFKGRFEDQSNQSCISEGGRFDDWMFPGGMFLLTKNTLLELAEYHKI